MPDPIDLLWALLYLLCPTLLLYVAILVDYSITAPESQVQINAVVLVLCSRQIEGGNTSPEQREISHHEALGMCLTKE